MVDEHGKAVLLGKFMGILSDTPWSYCFPCGQQMEFSVTSTRFLLSQPDCSRQA